MTESLQSILNARFATAIAAVAPGVELAETPVRPSKDPRFGDYQCNAALALAKSLGTKPREVAERIAAAAAISDLADRPEIAGPGFINIRLRSDFIARRLESIRPADEPSAGLPSLVQGSAPASASADASSRIAHDRLGIAPVPAPERKRVVVDYSSPNIAKQMHVGHIRSTIIGDVFARVLEFQGHEVIRQNHVGDWGTAIGMVILGLWYIETRHARGEGNETIAARVRSLLAIRERSADERRAALEPVRAAWQEDLSDDRLQRAIESRQRDVNLDELELGYQLVQALMAAADGLGLSVADASGERTDLTAIPRRVTQYLQSGEHPWERDMWRRARDISIAYCQLLYDRLGVLLSPADVCGESFYSLERDRLGEIVDELTRRLSPGPFTTRNPATDAARAELREDGGALCIFMYDDAGAPLFKTPEDAPLPLILRKSDGAYLYASTDLAALRYRVAELGAKRLIYVTAAPQKLHFRMFFEAARAAGLVGPDVSLEHVTFGIILGEDRRPFKTREGGTVRLADVLDEAVRRARALVDETDAKRHGDRGNADAVRESSRDQAILADVERGPTGENSFRASSPAQPLSDAEKQHIAERVGIASVKYADLCKDRNTDYVFSYDKMLAMQGNTAPYLLYAYARIRSIYRKATDQFAPSGVPSELRPEGTGALAGNEPEAPARGPLSAPSNVSPFPHSHADAYAADVRILLNEPAERALALRIASLPDAIDAVAADLLPHTLCSYLYDLASDFMRFYETCPVLTAPDAVTRLSRMRLCDLAARTLRLGLSLLGIPVIERM